MSLPTNDHAHIEAPLWQRFVELGINAVTHRHAALHTVEESKALRGNMPGVHIKNLFVRDKKRQMWLLTVHEDRQIDLKALRQQLGANGSLSFGNAELLREALGVDPGAVTPLAILNDREGRVRSVLDQALLQGPPVNAHPLHNEATVAMSPDDLLRFLEACGHPPLILNLDEH